MGRFAQTLSGEQTVIQSLPPELQSEVASSLSRLLLERSPLFHGVPVKMVYALGPCR